MFQCVYSGKTKYSTSNYNKFHFGPMDGKISHEKWIRKPKICLRRKVRVSHLRTHSVEIEEFLCESKSLCEINFSKIWVSKTTICKCEFKQWLKSKQWNFQKIELQSRSNHQNGNSWGKKCSNLISRKVWETDNSDFYTVCHDHEKYQCTMWKFRKFTLTHFWQKFRERNVFNNKK